MMSFGFPEIIVMTLVSGLFLGGLIFLGVVLVRPKNDTPKPSGNSAIATLEERYARGEITRDEFIERRATLRGRSD